MKQKTIQKLVLDSCVVIDLIEKSKFTHKFKKAIKGKQVSIILCDTVLDEVKRVRGLEAEQIVAKITQILNKKIEIENTTKEQRSEAEQISTQYSICHAGDNVILSMCKLRDFVLVTLDRMLLRTCEFTGVVGFHPLNAGGI